MAKRHPEVTVGVDRHTVWGTSVALLGSIDGDGGVANYATVIVVIIATDLFGHGVDVIHLCGIAIPADAIRVGDLVDFEMECPVLVQHVEIGGADFFNKADGTYPEASSGVAFAVVETVGRAFFGLGVG